MCVRAATANDIDSIINIENRVFQKPWSADQIVFELTQQPAAGTLVIENEQLIGYLIFHHVEKEFYILNFAIDIPFQHRGYGKKLLTKFLNDLESDSTVFLDVNRSNLNAVKLYLDMGFSEIARRDKYYEDGEDALIMVKRIK